MIQLPGTTLQKPGKDPTTGGISFSVNDPSDQCSIICLSDKAHLRGVLVDTPDQCWVLDPFLEYGVEQPKFENTAWIVLDVPAFFMGARAIQMRLVRSHLYSSSAALRTSAPVAFT